MGLVFPIQVRKTDYEKQNKQALFSSISTVQSENINFAKLSNEILPYVLYFYFSLSLHFHSLTPRGYTTLVL